MKRGIIVSIQGYSYQTISELAKDAISASCVGLRIDKKITLDMTHKLPIIGLKKSHVSDPKVEAYITANPEVVAAVAPWCDYVAIDARRCNSALASLMLYCKERRIKVVADIECFEDFQALKDAGYEYEFVSTTFSVFKQMYEPDIRLVEKLAPHEKKLIAEGNYKSRKDVKSAFAAGAYAVCIGGAISNVYKLTKKFTSVSI